MIGGFQPLAFQPAYQQGRANVGAGRSRRRRRYFVEVDGQRFWVDSAEEAQQLLARATSIAATEAPQAVERAVQRTSFKRLGRVEVELPAIVASPELATVVNPYRQQIEAHYAEAARIAEMRALFEQQMADEDEDDVIVLLM